MLVVNADIITAKGGIVYSNNWYTTIQLAKYLYESYQLLFVGTVVPSMNSGRFI